MTDDRLRQLLDSARGAYVDHYRAVVRHTKATRPQAVPEVLIELNTPVSALVQRLTRVDVIWGGAAKPSIIEANVDPPVAVECLHTTPRSPVVRLFSIVWNACEVLSVERFELGVAFEDWFRRWIDIDDARPQDADGLSGVIHSVTKPGRVGNKWGLSVDLGSAPVDAVLELLDVPELVGAGAVDLGSFTYGREL